MEITAKLNYYRTSPQKVRLVADLIRGKKVTNALSQLNFSKKKSAPIVARLLNSAISNAKHNFRIDTEKTDLYIKEIRVDEGPAYKRYKAQWRGTTHPYKRRTSHITVVLEERQKSKIQNLKSKKTINKKYE